MLKLLILLTLASATATQVCKHTVTIKISELRCSTFQPSDYDALNFSFKLDMTEKIEKSETKKPLKYVEYKTDRSEKYVQSKISNDHTNTCFKAIKFIFLGIVTKPIKLTSTHRSNLKNNPSANIYLRLNRVTRVTTTNLKTVLPIMISVTKMLSFLSCAISVTTAIENYHSSI